MYIMGIAMERTVSTFVKGREVFILLFVNCNNFFNIDLLYVITFSKI